MSRTNAGAGATAAMGLRAQALGMARPASTAVAAPHKITAKNPAKVRLRGRAMLFFLQNMGSLLENGLSVPKSLNLMAREVSMRRYSALLDEIRHRVETGQSLSAAMDAFPGSFDKLTVHEIRTAEQAGTAAETLGALAQQLEHRLEMRANVIKKVSYPIMTLLAGMIAVTIMMVAVIPQFKQTFAQAKLELPLSTRTLIATADFTRSYGWIIVLVVAVAVIAVFRARRVPDWAYRIDQVFLRLPVIGNLLRDLAVLQFVTVLSRMMGSGFKLVDALGSAVDSVGNQVMRRAIGDLRQAVSRGEKLSVRLEHYEHLFPAVISQLVVTGEQTGNLAKATQSVRRHLSRQVERKLDRLVATIEPALTLGLVVIVGMIMLGIYEPMFAMLEALEK